jgi:hypothetical protein
MWLIHEHSHYTSAIDKYWTFDSKEEAVSRFKELVTGYKDIIDLDHLQELHELSESDLTFEKFVEKAATEFSGDCVIHLLKDDYLVLAEFKSGFARRP